MMTMQSRTFIAVWGLAACLLVGGVQGVSSQPDKVLAGAVDDYALYCAACHGPHGRGDGEMAPNLIQPPSDLTQITARHGAFPFWRVYDMISGEVAVPGHVSFQMPKYAERMKADEGKPGYLPAHHRILLLTHYLERLQPRQGAR